MIIKKRRRIKRKPGQTGHMYFSDVTQEAITQFQLEENEKLRHELYVKSIHPAFEALVENLILVYGFGVPGEPIDSLKGDCISFLYSSIFKWSPEKGTKAFSYFNVVAKNFLIANTRKAVNLVRRYVSIEQPELLTLEQSQEIESYAVVPSPDDILIERNHRNEIMEILAEIEDIVETEHEQACIKAIISVFERVDELDFLNKRAVRIYIRDISGLTSKKLSTAMSSIRVLYREISQCEHDLF